MTRDLNRFSLRRLTAARSLGEHDGARARTSEQYLFSGNAVAHLVDTYGADRFLAFYHSYSEVTESEAWDALEETQGLSRMISTTYGQLATRLTDNALRRHFDTDVATLDRAVKEWMWLRYR